MPLQGRPKEQLAATTALAAIETADAHSKHRPPMKARQRELNGASDVIVDLLTNIAMQSSLALDFFTELELTRQ